MSLLHGAIAAHTGEMDLLIARRHLDEGHRLIRPDGLGRHSLQVDRISVRIQILPFGQGSHLDGAGALIRAAGGRGERQPDEGCPSNPSHEGLLV